ncbi:GNAT family N-acetyltransferase [Actinomadura sp. DC4]|uniref:GNAT family N-acetyltransferase n=1 Tax=Actinomadura sp. DC4 TaxID=3055069 RepID=UPI0025B04667|nr:GNAT family N-acetyltransferase [Actinomadura sp. DC4]MDN3355314.1 GNAT family N-acetyltransferase [Actinomadura sp. DC4]
MEDPYDLTLRPITGHDELDLFTRLPSSLDDELAGDLAGGLRRPEWMWVALRGDRLVARAAWWARPGHDEPYVLDVFDLDDATHDRVDVGVRLLETAMAEVPVTPQYCRFVPPGWRDDPAVRGPVGERMSALERTGAHLFVERLRLEWRYGTPVPEPRGRLSFRPPGSPVELITLMADVLDGTLDAHSRADLTRTSPWEAAVAKYEDELAGYASPRSWWRIATLPDGEPVGFVIPARNAYNPIIAYIGVRPGHRGNGYVDDLLAEGTRVLAAQDAPLIHASTDLGNVPMARAFARAGYVAYEHQIDMTWS